MANLATLTVTLDANSAKLVNEMKRAEAESKRFGSSFGRQMASGVRAVAALGAAAAAAGAALAFSQAAAGIKRIDELAKTADKLGVSTEKLAGLRFAAQQTGVETATLDRSLQNLTRRVSEAAQGSGEAARSIRALGLDAAVLNKLPLDQKMATVATALQGVENQADRVRIAIELFGARGAGLVNTLAQGEDGLRAFQAEAERLGLAVSRIDAAKIEAANDSINKAKQAFQGLGNQFTIAVAPVIEAFANSLTEAVVNVEGLESRFKSFAEGLVVAAGLARNAWLSVVIAVQSLQLAFVEAQIAGNSLKASSQSLIRMKKSAMDTREEIQALVERAGELRIAMADNVAGRKALEELRADAVAFGEAVEQAAQRAAEAAQGRVIDAEALGAGAGSAVIPPLDVAKLQAQEQQRADIALSALRNRLAQAASMEDQFEQARVEARRISDEELLRMAEANATAQVQLRFAAEQAAKGELGVALTPEEELAQIEEVNNEKLRLYERYLNERSRMEARAAKESIANDQSMLRSKQSFYQNILGFMRAFAGGSKAVNAAILAVEKGKAIADTFIWTKAAQLRAIAELGPIAGPPAAAKIGLFGKLNMGLIAATGLAGIAGGGGGSFGAMGDTTATTPTMTADESRQRQEASAVRIQFTGDMYGWDEYVQEKVIAGIREATRNQDIIVIDADSRNARDIQGAAFA